MSLIVKLENKLLGTKHADIKKNRLQQRSCHQGFDISNRTCRGNPQPAWPCQGQA
jgi:hypothetical protein